MFFSHRLIPTPILPNNEPITSVSILAPGLGLGQCEHTTSRNQLVGINFHSSFTLPDTETEKLCTEPKEICIGLGLASVETFPNIITEPNSIGLGQRKHTIRHLTDSYT